MLQLVGAVSYVVAARPTVERIVGKARAKQLDAQLEREAIAFAHRALGMEVRRCALSCSESLVRRILAHLDARTTDTGAGPHREPVASYVDPVRHAREVGALFRELPLAIAHSSQLATPGDFLTHDASGVPLLVVRGDDGELAAFLNVCRHRGTRVEELPCGCEEGVRVPVPRVELRPRRLAARHPARARASPASTRKTAGSSASPSARPPGSCSCGRPPGERSSMSHAWLGPSADDLAGFGIATAHVYAPRAMTKELSWKLAIDVFLEAYHLRTAHRDSIYPLFFDNVGLVDRDRPAPAQRVPEAHDPRARRRARRRAGGCARTRTSSSTCSRTRWSSSSRTTRRCSTLWPLGPARTLRPAYTLVPEPPATDKARAYWDANNAILYGATDEDFAMGESIQRGLRRARTARSCSARSSTR